MLFFDLLVALRPLRKYWEHYIGATYLARYIFIINVVVLNVINSKYVTETTISNQKQEMRPLFLCGWPLNFPIRDGVFKYSYSTAPVCLYTWYPSDVVTRYCHVV